MTPNERHEIAWVLFGAALLLAIALLPGGGPFGDGIVLFTTVIFSLIVFSVLGTLAHELGHALAVVALTPERAVIRMGHKDAARRVNFGRIELNLDVDGMLAHCEWNARATSPGRLALVSLAGPFGSLLFALPLLAIAFVLKDTSELLALAAAVGAGLNFLEGVVWNLLPFRQAPRWPDPSFDGPRSPSDGYFALTEIRAWRKGLGPVESKTREL